MSAYGTQIFYCRTHDNNNIYDVIETLNQHFYKPYVKNEISENAIIAEPVKQEEKLIVANPTRLFDNKNYITPTHKDSLFWCLYILKYGYNEYIQIQRNYVIKKMELNQSIIDYLMTRQYKMKGVNARISKARIQEMFSDMMINHKDTHMVNVYGIICFYEYNIIMLDETKNTFIRFQADEPDEKPTYLLRRDGYNNYSIIDDALTDDKIQDIENRFVALENFDKPLKGISNYKTNDLETYMEKLGIVKGNDKIKKPDMFNMIWEHMKW